MVVPSVSDCTESREAVQPRRAVRGEQTLKVQLALSTVTCAFSMVKLEVITGWWVGLEVNTGGWAGLEVITGWWVGSEVIGDHRVVGGA